MSVPTTIATPETDPYPESDGRPMADNTEQYRYIVLIKENLEELFLDRPDVLVVADLLWYPVEKQPGMSKVPSQAPDVMVVFGRPKGPRRSYKQWLEGGIAPQVVFEILSDSNTSDEMEKKFGFYQRYGVDEYYVFDPDSGRLQGFLREGEELMEMAFVQGWKSPRLQVTFEIVGRELDLIRPDGTRFSTFSHERRRAQEEARRAEEQTRRAEEQTRRAEQARADTEQALRLVEEQTRRAEEQARLAEQERAEKQRAFRLAEQERAEKEQALQRLAELERLLAQRPPPEQA